jgi:NitT/TauT family transport system substrate-binding protein
MEGKMRRTSSWATVGAGLLLGAMVLAACSAGTAPAPAQRAPQAAAPAPAAAPAAARGMDAYPTADDQEVKIRAAWCAVAGAMFPLWVAKEAGIFTRHRLDAELVFMQGGSPCQAAMMNGEVDFLESAGGLIPGLMTSGEGLVIANFYMGNPYRLIVVPDIQTVPDLRGRKLAISRPGEFDNRLSEVMLERHGLVPNQDVTLIPIGGQTDRYNALKGGIVDGTTVNPPVNLAARNEGFREIYNLSDMNYESVYISLYTARQTMDTRPRVVERFLAAMIEAAVYARSDKEYTVKLMGDYLKLNDRQALEGAYQAYAVEMLAIPPRVGLEAVQNVMDETLRVAPGARVRDAALLVDTRALDKVEASGFVDAVQAKYPAPRN